MLELIKKFKVKIPVIWIKRNQFLVGTQRVICDHKNDNIIVKVGTDFKTFQKYMKENEEFERKMLVSHMIKSDQSLEWVCDQLIKGKRITASGENVPIIAPFSKASNRPSSRPGSRSSHRSAKNDHKMSFKDDLVSPYATVGPIVGRAKNQKRIL